MISQRWRTHCRSAQASVSLQSDRIKIFDIVSRDATRGWNSMDLSTTVVRNITLTKYSLGRRCISIQM